MVEIHNGIVAACTRNAQSKDATTVTRNAPTLITTSRLSLQERLAAVTKGKSIRPTVSTSSSFSKQQQKQHTDDRYASLIQQSLDGLSALEDCLKDIELTSRYDGVYNNCRKLHSTICSKIPEISDSTQLGKRFYCDFAAIINTIDYVELLLGINDRLITSIQLYETKSKELDSIKKEEFALSQSFEIGDDDDDDDDDDIIMIEQELDNHLQQLRSGLEAEEGATFLKAKNIESDELEDIDINTK